ncbi:MAG: OsmC family protein [Gemmatimonadota bacterium]
MRVTLERQNDAVHFVATTEAGGVVAIDGSPAVGGLGLGARPMELLLAGIGGCSGIDVVSILQKQRETVSGVTITVDAEREQDKEPALFKTVHVHFAVRGPHDDSHVARAVELTMSKYCSVARILEPTATITWSHTLHGAPA